VTIQPAASRASDTSSRRREPGNCAGGSACRWLGPPVAVGTVGVPMDPLRTRLLCLQALSAAEQAEFLTTAEEGLKLHLEQLHGIGIERAQQESPAHILVLQGAIAMMQARIAWLRAVIARRE
jgi:Virulence activator alpha C-term